MILNRYIQRTFITKFIHITLICLILATFVELAHDISQCQGVCTPTKVFLGGVTRGILFTNNALFFIIAITSVWFTLYMTNTMQMQIITVYGGTPTLIMLQIFKVLTIMSVFYVFIFNGIILSAIIKNKDTEKIENFTIPTMWFKSVSIKGGTSSANFYLLQNIRPYKFGFIVDSIKEYKVENGYLVNYSEHRNTFVTQKHEESETTFFSLSKPNTLQKRTILNTSIKDLEQHFKIRDENSGFYSNLSVILHKSQSTQDDYQKSIASIMNTIQTCLSLFVATLIVCTQLFSFYNTRFKGIHIKIAQTITYLIITYTLFEVVKVVGTHVVTNQIISVTTTVSVALVFLSRFIKLHH
jgi:hypothetical protein